MDFINLVIDDEYAMGWRGFISMEFENIGFNKL